MVSGKAIGRQPGGTLRPALHFTVERGWINDPHGITYRDGVYHAFYQYVPDSTRWAPNCHWGHAVGPDLLSLSPLPVALAPGSGDDGVWSGSLAVDDSGQAHIFYTSVSVPDFGIGDVRVATPSDAGWIEWQKGSRAAGAPGDLDVVAYRDPFVFRDGQAWRMFVGAALPGGTAAALSYSSQDLDTWGYDGIAAQRSTDETDPVWTGALWECPQLFQLDGKHVLVTSVWENDVLHYAAYGIGRYSDGTFEAETWGRLTYGPSFYAPSFFRDAHGRACLLFWMRGVQDEDEGWASCHSVPHLLSIESGRLVARPHPDIEKYRSTKLNLHEPTRALIADVTWRPNGEGSVLRVTSGEEDVLAITTRGSNVDIRCLGETCSLPAFPGETRIIIDNSVVEVSTPAGLAGFPVKPVGDGLIVQASSGAVTVVELAR